MSKKGRISHDRIEALEKEVAELKQRLEALEKSPALLPGDRNQARAFNGYIPQFDHWPGNER